MSRNKNRNDNLSKELDPQRSLDKEQNVEYFRVAFILAFTGKD